MTQEELKNQTIAQKEPEKQAESSGKPEEMIQMETVNTKKRDDSWDDFVEDGKLMPWNCFCG